MWRIEMGERSDFTKVSAMRLILWDDDNPDETTWVLRAQYIRIPRHKPQLRFTRRLLSGHRDTHYPSGAGLMHIKNLPREAKRVIRQYYPLVMILLSED